VQCTKISPEFECQGQKSGSPGTKKALSAADAPGCARMVWARCKQRAAAADGPISWLIGGVFGCRPPVLRRWENQRMLSSLIDRCSKFFHRGLDSKVSTKSSPKRSRQPRLSLREFPHRFVKYSTTCRPRLRPTAVCVLRRRVRGVALVQQ